eukprot:TRINITY_DN992_c0_g1_i1.p1 TRINITY_DN992_c0_g1~~TRINITY_DN992_c0_g1_i1.p1  ORF type:complete len:882 (+),score=146.00 TRINITY_DN992_c0_g1_i1:3085-5730(+)
MSQKLRDLIRHVRSCKTAADERAVISKECAAIRTALKEGNAEHRAKNVAKLMYIHMLGYSTAFGQVECINLIASEKYSEKRVGYLGMMVLLDEKQEVLTLGENHIKKDMRDANEYVQGLALCTLANISSEDMLRGLATEILSLLNSPNPYVKKKAALCALRVIRKVGSADMIEMYLEPLSTSLLNERNHGVLVSTLALVSEALQHKEGQKMIAYFRKLVPVAVRMLKNLVMSSYALEHDINGVADPFLQVRLLQLLRILGNGDRKAVEQMNDVLAQVATNTESSKNCGNAILYECVTTIVGIDADPGLRVLAVNILGRFLVNRDNNIRYVALNTLTKVVDQDLQAVQRHKNTIVDCLKDVDVSIRRRALDLIYTLVNSSNIRLLVPDLINYLTFANNDLKEDLATKICSVVERYAPSLQWHIDTLVKVLALAGSFVSESVGTKLIALITQAPPELQSYCVKVMWSLMAQNAPVNGSCTSTADGSEEDAIAYCAKETLIQVSVWVIGEYSDLLTTEARTDVAVEDSNSLGIKDWRSQTPIAEQLVLVLSALITTHYITSSTVKQYIVSALLKIAGRFPETRESISAIFERNSTSRDVELQQRCCEFALLLPVLDACTGLVEHMPAIEAAGLRAGGELPLSPIGIPDPTQPLSPQVPAVTAPPAAVPVPPSADDIFEQMFSPISAGSSPSQPPVSGGGTDIFEIFGPEPVRPTPPAPAPVAPPAPTPIDPFFPTERSNPFLTPTPVQQQTPPPQTNPFTAPVVQAGPRQAKVNVLSKEISVDFSCVQSAQTPTTTTIHVTFTNQTPAQYTDFSFLAAVPKAVKLTMHPLSSTVLAPNGVITQQMVIENPASHKPVSMRLKVKYFSGTGVVEEDLKVTNLPAWL